ncbi:MAG TPA: hypothetical protein VEN81_08495, partial [Planctomycetota bacterium]|nr:hypothetical protein [Planctomycetota bacterium]
MWSFVLMGFIAFPTLQDRDVDDGYSFFIDGEPRNLRPWSLNGNPVVRATGDVVFVGEIPIVLGEPGIWRFRTTPEEDGRLFRVDDNGKETVIGVSIGWNMKDGKKIIFDPISRLSDDEIRGLQGLRLDSWPPGLEKKLALMNPARMGVVVTDRVEQDGALPALPEGLRYLWVSESSSAGIKDFTTLASQRELRILGLDLVAAKAFDVSLLKGNTSLRVLSLGMKKLLNIESLAVLTELRIADLQWNEEVRTIEWVRGMKSLKAIYLHGTGVGDLSPLEGLSSLATVRANQAPVRQLPRGSLPALREMSILSTKISDAEADAFRRANPGCKVAHRWMSTLQEALASATRLRVRSGGTCHRRVSEEKTLIEIKDPKEVQAFVKSLVVDETQSDRHCMCCGDPSFEFYEGDKLVATLGFHHGSGLRWPGGWPADAAPTAE